MKTILIFVFSHLLASPVFAVIWLANCLDILGIDGERKLVKVGETFSGVTLKSAESEEAVIETSGEKQSVVSFKGLIVNMLAPRKRD
jgi:hypothetical protein